MKKSLFKSVFDDLKTGVIEDFPYSLDSSGKGSTALPDGQHLDEEASRDFFGMWVSGDGAAKPLQNVKYALLGNHG